MAKKPDDLSPSAVAGYNGEPMSALYSSPVHYAHALGEHFKESGRSVPRDVRMSRGMSIRANDMLFAIKGESVKFPYFERVN